MSTVPKIALIALACFGTLAASAAAPPQSQSDSSPPGAEQLFRKGVWEFSLNNGALFGPFPPASTRDTINFSISEIWAGYMLSGVKGKGVLWGNFELAASGFGGGIFKGPGAYVAGGTLWLRYNFVPQDWRVIPFLHFGMGLTSTDIDRNIVGQPFNFNLNLGGGVRYFLSDHWAASLEFRYQHLSNANTGPRNIGINSGGPLLGISYFF